MAQKGTELDGDTLGVEGCRSSGVQREPHLDSQSRAQQGRPLLPCFFGPSLLRLISVRGDLVSGMSEMAH
jgi:hypothetical protein